MPFDLSQMMASLGATATAAGPSQTALALRRRTADRAAAARSQRASLIASLQSAGAGVMSGAGVRPSQVGTVMPAGSAGGSGRAQMVAQAAQRFLGTPYVWGGTTKRGIDCSGLVYAAARQAGISAARLRASGWGRSGTAVSAPNARVGDVVYFDNPGATDHVGIYLGNGRFIEAQQAGTNVMISKLRGGAQFRRLW